MAGLKKGHAASADHPSRTPVLEATHLPSFFMEYLYKELLCSACSWNPPSHTTAVFSAEGNSKSPLLQQEKFTGTHQPELSWRLGMTARYCAWPLGSCRRIDLSTPPCPPKETWSWCRELEAHVTCDIVFWNLAYSVGQFIFRKSENKFTCWL